MTVDVQFDAEANVATCGGESLVFHCHYYNCALHKAIEDGIGPDAAAVLQSSAARVIERQIRALSAGRAEVEELFSTLGFGKLNLSSLNADGGEAVIHGSHYAMGWTALHGDRETPVCLFPAGFIQGAVSAMRDLPLDRIKVAESRCYAAGAGDCRFKVEVL